MFFVRGLICFFGVVLILLVMALIAAKINELNAKAELYKRESGQYHDDESRTSL